MTRAETRDRVSHNLDDAGMIQFTDVNINDSIQDGYEEVSLLEECIEKVATVSFTSNLTYYDFSALISDYYRVMAIWNPNISDWMEPVSIRTLDEMHPRWESVNGNEKYFCPIGFQYVAFFRKQAVATGNMLVFYKAVAETLAEQSIPKIPVGSTVTGDSTVNTILENYATADLLQQNLEYTKMSMYHEKYIAQLKLVRRLLHNRNAADRIYTLSCQYGLMHI